MTEACACKSCVPCPRYGIRVFAGPPVSSITKWVCFCLASTMERVLSCLIPWSYRGAFPIRGGPCIVHSFCFQSRPQALALRPAKCLSAHNHTRDDHIELSEWIQLCPVQNKVSGCPAAVSMPCSTLTRELSWSSPCLRCLDCLIPHFTMSRSALVFKLAGVLFVLGPLRF